MSGIKALDTLKGTISSERTLSGKLTATGGLSGKLSTSTADYYEVYDGDYEVIPKAFNTQTLETADKLLKENIQVKEVPFFETSNDSGTTVYIAREVD